MSEFEDDVRRGIELIREQSTPGAMAQNKIRELLEANTILYKYVMRYEKEIARLTTAVELQEAENEKLREALEGCLSNETHWWKAAKEALGDG